MTRERRGKRDAIPPRILIVEDEAPLIEVLAETVRRFGYNVSLASTAAEALTLAELDRPDAILLDIALPDAARTSTLDRFRVLRSNVPIIMLTGNTDEALARETLKRGAFDYVMKPFNVGQLARVLEAALASSGR